MIPPTSRLTRPDLSFARIVSGKKVSYATVPDEQLYAILQPFAGDRAAGCVVEMYKGIREVGCTYLSSARISGVMLILPMVDYGGDDLLPSNAHLAKPARTFLQALEARQEVIKKFFGGQA